MKDFETKSKIKVRKRRNVCPECGQVVIHVTDSPKAFCPECKEWFNLA